MPYQEDRSTWFEGQGLWQHIPASDWQDWGWQLKNRLTTMEQLERYMTLTPEERAGCLILNRRKHSKEGQRERLTADALVDNLESDVETAEQLLEIGPAASG